MATTTVAVCAKPDLTLYGHIKPQSNGLLYRNTVIGTLAVDWWAVAFGQRVGAWAMPCQYVYPSVRLSVTRRYTV